MSSLDAEILLHDIRNCIAGLKANVYLLRLQGIPEAAGGTIDRLERIAENLEHLAGQEVGRIPIPLISPSPF
jgi:hypothetical protein